MTSKEALEILGDIPLGDNHYHLLSSYELKKVYSIEYEAIKKDLEVLDIFKRGYGDTRENQFYTVGNCDLGYYIDANYADFYPSRMELTKEEYDETIS